MKIGAKRMFAFSILLSSTSTLAMALLYFMHDHHFILAVILRILSALGHGPLFPGTYAFWSVWAVPLERGTLTSIGFCSTNLGTCKSTLFFSIIVISNVFFSLKLLQC
jgi:MFS family permease